MSSSRQGRSSRTAAATNLPNHATNWKNFRRRSRNKAAVYTDGEKDLAKQAKLYLKAKEELSKSVGYHGHFDGYLALGQVYLALGQKDSAFDSCSRAQAMKPNDEAARSGVEQARP